ncbi:uncharacterized protein TNIN_494351 [Trichonephila inaurata madagascariensis]|uniref:Uncharacterized protein n=1 Tax=Trichonephila inaurata madagascariensis TaxID=2747483 RepID=A0A8X6JR63_9ARAC|nr:uncharacterized protein TNIN_494351 [Trichonephila inaurata madagascariensis]
MHHVTAGQRILGAFIMHFDSCPAVCDFQEKRSPLTIARVIASYVDYTFNFVQNTDDKTRERETNLINRFCEVIQQQYELEGRIKILSVSIENLSKELREEKLNKDRIISQKVQEFKEKENVLQKDIEKLKISLQFKNQEMKTISDKAHLLEFQLKERKEIQEKDISKNLIKEKAERQISPQSSNIQVSNEFSKRFKFESGHPLRTSNEQNSSKGSFRKFKLQVNSPKGKTPGCDLVSSILCNRLVISPAQSSFFSPLTPNQGPDAVSTNSSQISAVSIARLHSNKQTEELINYFDCSLQKYLTHLKAISSRTVVAGSNKASPLSLRRKEFNQDRACVISNLKDLAFFLSSHQFASLIQKLEFVPGDLNRSDQKTDQTSNNQSLNCDKMTFKLNERLHSLLKTLVHLSNPNTYPSGCPKNEEIEWSLASLVSWSSTASESLIQFVGEIPFVPLINGDHSVESLCLVLQLLTNFCSHKGIISAITHQDVCVLCAVAHLVLLKISTSPMKYLNIMIKVEDFLSVIFTLYSFSELRLESSSCPTLILQGIVTSLWKFYEIGEKEISTLKLVFKKGFTLLHLLSRYFPNFKERRVAFEDCYISLVCGILKLTKENTFFKEFCDLIHDLWDFQDDTSELDLDEPCEDSTQNDASSQNNS